jgi:hypothetical protein
MVTQIYTSSANNSPSVSSTSSHLASKLNSSEGIAYIKSINSWKLKYLFYLYGKKSNKNMKF